MASHDITSHIETLLAGGWTIEELDAYSKEHTRRPVYTTRDGGYEAGSRAQESLLLSLRPKGAAAEAPRITHAQIRYLLDLGADYQAIRGLSRVEASAEIDRLKGAPAAARQARANGRALGIDGEVWD